MIRLKLFGLRFCLIILVININSSCIYKNYKRSRIFTSLEKDRSIFLPRELSLLQKDSLICYSSDFLLTEYTIPGSNSFFIYQENGKYYLEIFFGFYKFRFFSKFLPKKAPKIRQSIYYKGPYEIDAKPLFDFYFFNRIDTVTTAPQTWRGNALPQTEEIFVKVNNDSTAYLMTVFEYESDTTHLKSELLKLTATTIKNANIQFKRKKVKTFWGTRLYDL